MAKFGYIVRVIRDEKAVNLDIVELTDKELDTFVDNLDIIKTKSWLKGIIKHLRDRLLESA